MTISQTKKPIPTQLRDYIAEFQIALDDEIQALRKSGGQRTYLTSGRYLSQRRDGYYLYAFVADSEIRFQDDTPIELEIRGSLERQTIEGILVSVEAFDVILALKKKANKTIPSAILNTSPIFLLKKLKERLDSALQPSSNMNHDIAQLLMRSEPIAHKDTTGNAADLLESLESRFNINICRNSDQEAAVEKVLTHKVSFIWGPPGTGKTTTLGMTVAALAMAGESVLVLSHSNMAVDTAMLSIAKYLKKAPYYKEGLVLRHGIPIPKILDEYPMLRAKNVLKSNEPDLIKKIDDLKNERRSLMLRLRSKDIQNNDYAKKQIIKDIERLDQKLKPLKVERRNKEKQLTIKAMVVGCTLSKAIIADEIPPDKYDTVIVDEASMVSIPHCFFAALLAKRRIAVYGDFRQLGPIAKADTPAVENWLKKDIFEYSRVMHHVNQLKDDPRMAMLQTQYRMYPAIADIPNRLCYNQLLVNGSKVKIDNQKTVMQSPFPGKALVLQDLSTLRADCIKEQESKSRFNILSALVAANVAYQSVEENPLSNVGIIAPYGAQSRLIHRMLRDIGKDEQVKASTVHRFQGSERSVIIFDAVDSDPNPKIGLPLKGALQSGAMRLANVAISRAKGKFIGVMNIRYIRNKLDTAQFSAFRKFTEYLHQRAAVHSLSWETLMKTITLPKVTCFADAESAKPHLEKSLWGATDDVAIYWPGQTFEEYFNPAILKDLNERGVGFYLSGIREADMPLELQDTQIWNNGLSTLNGFIGVNEKCLWIFQDPADPNAGILKLELPKTVKLLYGFLRLIPHYPTLPPDPYPFGQCSCRSPMKIDSIGKGHFITCLKYPRHLNHITRWVKPNDATKLADQTKHLCEKCGSKLIGQKSHRTGQIILVCSSQNCDWVMNLNSLL